MKKRLQSGSFKFQKNDRIGAAGAEEDLALLQECFVDTGDLALLESFDDNRVVLLGRTGTGKSALLTMLSSRNSPHVIHISPENLALTYVTNSTILKFFSSLGVNLDPFFKLLWRHVLTVEILSHYFPEKEGDKQKSLLDRLREFFSGTSKKDKDMQQAISYLEGWGQNFWKETEFRVKEITSTLEKELSSALKAQVGSDLVSFGGDIGDVKKITETKRAELLTRGQDVVSKAQVQDLQKVLKLLGTVLADRQKKYYIVIDGLDEKWVEERLRYKLIMALIQTARDFIEIDNAKIIIALRRDLIERVFRLTRDSGFQEEKYQSLYLPLHWDKDDILAVLDRRIQKLFARRYTKQSVSHLDFLPQRFRGLSIGDYIYSVARRPRDVIAFFNTCIAAATDQPELTTRELRIAEGEYSQKRLRALGDEWSGDYPTLLDFTEILERKPCTFKIISLQEGDIEELCLLVAEKDPAGTGVLQKIAMQVVDCVISIESFKFTLIQTFYRVGLVGLKLAPYERESWTDELGRSVSSAEITNDTSVTIHPSYRRALGVVESPVDV